MANVINLSSEFRIYKVVYTFNHSKMGFNNQISIEARDEEEAIYKAKIEISGVYGKKMLNRFSFKC